MTTLAEQLKRAEDRMAASEDGDKALDLRANAAPEPAPEPRGFVVVLPAFSANKRLQPVIRGKLYSSRHAFPVMVPTDEYETWKREAGQELMVQRPTAVSGPVAVSIVLVPHKTNMDTDNVVKSVLDLLVEHGKIDGDSVKTVRRLDVEVWMAKQEAIPAGHVQIRVRALPKQFNKAMQGSAGRGKAQSGTAGHGCA